MPSPRSKKPLYQRGKYRLIERPGRNHEIVWYDAANKRERSRSAGSRDLRLAKDALDRLYLQRERGHSVCPTCGKPWEDNRQFLLVQAMMDYDTARRSRPSYDAIHARLKHVHAYLKATAQTDIACESIDAEWIEAFEEWAIEVPVELPNGATRERAPATVNNSVLQLAAAINFAHRRKDTLFPASFRPKQPEAVNRTPTYRADIGTLAKMFEYALEPRRGSLLNFLRIGVVTLIRPEHALLIDTTPAKGMWHPDARVLNLLPRGQEQTRKRRPIVPVARQAVDWLNAISGQVVPVADISSSWDRMKAEIGLPGDGQAGPKLIRRSMAHLVNQRIDKRDRAELEMFLGHRTGSATTDLYAPFDPEYLSRARAAIEGVIDDIDSRVPGAFHRNHPATRAKVVSIASGKNA